MSATTTTQFAAFTFVPPTSDVLQYKAGTLAVAVAASVSWCCCVVLLSWISYLLYSMYAKRNERASKYAFLRTQFGLLFANLLVADLIQSTAFGLSYFWYFTDKRPQISASPVCTVQALGIQSGDLASAIWSFIIALHTIVFIVWRYKVPNKAAIATVPLVWAVVIVMTSIGPIHVRVLRSRGHEAGPFYNNAGLWCWIGLEYEPWRVYSHYLFVFISAFGSLTLYGSVFLYLWFRLFQKGMYNHQLFQLRRAADGRLVPTSNTPVVPSEPEFATPGAEDEEKAALGTTEPTVLASQPVRIKQRIKDQHAADRNRKVDRAALLMLLFPACYILSILPLASFRLARISKQPWSYSLYVQAGCGFLFALGGTFNAVLYALTRRIFQSSGQGSTSPYNSANATGSRLAAVSGANANGVASQTYQVDFEQTRPGSQKHRKESHDGSIGGSSDSSAFPAGVDVGRRMSTQAWQPTAVLFGRRISSDTGRRFSSDSNGSARQQASGVRPGLQRKPSGLGQTVQFASGHRGQRRDDGTWDDGLSFQDSTDAGHSVYELSREEQDEAEGEAPATDPAVQGEATISTSAANLEPRWPQPEEKEGSNGC